MGLSFLCPSSLLEAKAPVKSSSKRQATSESFKKDRIQAAQKLDLLKSQYELARQFLQAESDRNQKAAELLVLVDNAYAWLVESGLQPKSFVLNRTLFAKAFSATKSELLPETVESLALLLKASRTRRISPGAIAGISIASVAALVTLVAVMMAARGFLPKYQKPVEVDQLGVGPTKCSDSDFMVLIKAGKANAYTVARDGTIHTPLGYAVHFNIKAIPLLLAKGADPFWRLSNSDDAFYYAFRYIDAFRALLNGHTSFIHKKDDKNGQTLLHRAVFRADYRPFLDDLLQRGARVNEVDNDGLTPLGLIASNQGARIDYEYFITQLCEHGADMHKKTKSSNGTEVESPLILSIEYHNVPILELFLKRLLADGQLDEHKKSLTKARKTQVVGDVAMVKLFAKYKIPLN
jgi:hypothetical protein